MARSRSFTLIELLVVIAVIAILAALLLPALSSAKAKGKQIACLGNMKQVGFAFQAYADENADYIPAVVTFDGASYSNWWDRVSIWNMIYSKPWFWGGLRNNNFFGSVFSCPSIKDLAPNTVSAHQALNSFYLQSSSVDALNPHRRGACKSPSATLLFGEGNGHHVKPSSPFNDVSNSMSLFFYHNAFSNLISFDGHASSLSWTQYSHSSSDSFWTGK